MSAILLAILNSMVPSAAIAAAAAILRLMSSPFLPGVTRLDWRRVYSFFPANQLFPQKNESKQLYANLGVFGG